MGRHAASGSDGPDRGDAPATGGRRRSDVPGGAWPPADPEVGGELSEHATGPGRRRADRRREAAFDTGYESGRIPPPDARPDLPAPASRRPPVPPRPAPRPVAPHTSVVPFQMPNPAGQDRYSPERLAETPVPGSPPSGLPLDGGGRERTARPAAVEASARTAARPAPAEVPPRRPAPAAPPAGARPPAAPPRLPAADVPAGRPPARAPEVPPRPQARPAAAAPAASAGSTAARPAPAGAPPRPSARTAPPDLPPGHPSAPVPDPARSAAPRYAAAPTAPTAPAAPPTEAVPAAPRRAAEPRPSPWSTGRTGVRADAPRPASAALAAGLRAGVLPGQTHPSGPIYGDWTRPSRSGSDGPGSGEERLAAPETTAIPERNTSRSGDHFDDDSAERAYPDDESAERAYPDDKSAERAYRDDDSAERAYDDEDDDEPVSGAGARSAGTLRDRRGPLTDPGTGPSTEVRGGRAADRAARQAFDVERRKELKRQGETMTARAYLDGDDLDGPRGPGRKVLALVAIAVIALGVLGVYSFISPATQEAASRGATEPTTAGAPPSGVADATLPPLEISPPSVADTEVAPVVLPVTVLNATDVDGLAGRVATALQGQGWETPATGQYTGGDVSVTTVFFTAGDENERQAAVTLQQAFPQITGGPTERFFELPEGTTSGLVVVTAGDWQP